MRHGKPLTLAALIALGALLTACAPAAEPAPEKPAASEPAGDDAGETGETDATGETLGVTESCELFNTTYAELRTIAADDADAYDDVYLAVEEALPTVAPETSALFSALSATALEASLGEGVSAETEDALGTAFLAASGDCTAAGVTLKM